MTAADIYVGMRFQKRSGEGRRIVALRGPDSWLLEYENDDPHVVHTSDSAFIILGFETGFYVKGHDPALDAPEGL